MDILFLTQMAKEEVMMQASSGHQSIATYIAFEKNGLKSFIFHPDFECTQLTHMGKQWGSLLVQRIIKEYKEENSIL